MTTLDSEPLAHFYFSAADHVSADENSCWKTYTPRLEDIYSINCNGFSSLNPNVFVEFSSYLSQTKTTPSTIYPDMFVSSAEELQKSTDSFNNSYFSPRYLLAATSSNDEHLHITSDNAEVFSVQPERIEQYPSPFLSRWPFPFPRARHAVTSLGDHIYIFGGSVGPTDRHNLQSDLWSIRIRENFSTFFENALPESQQKCSLQKKQIPRLINECMCWHSMKDERLFESQETPINKHAFSIQQQRCFNCKTNDGSNEGHASEEVQTEIRSFRYLSHSSCVSTANSDHLLDDESLSGRSTTDCSNCPNLPNGLTSLSRRDRHSSFASASSFEHASHYERFDLTKQESNFRNCIQKATFPDSLPCTPTRTARTPKTSDSVFSHQTRYLTQLRYLGPLYLDWSPIDAKTRENAAPLSNGTFKSVKIKGQTITLQPWPTRRGGATLVSDPTTKCLFLFGGYCSNERVSPPELKNAKENILSPNETILPSLPNLTGHSDSLYNDELWVYALDQQQWTCLGPPGHPCASRSADRDEEIKDNEFSQKRTGNDGFQIDVLWPEGRAGHSAVIYEGRMIIYGGLSKPLHERVSNDARSERRVTEVWDSRTGESFFTTTHTRPANENLLNNERQTLQRKMSQDDSTHYGDVWAWDIGSRRWIILWDCHSFDDSLSIDSGRFENDDSSSTTESDYENLYFVDDEDENNDDGKSADYNIPSVTSHWTGWISEPRDHSELTRKRSSYDRASLSGESTTAAREHRDHRRLCQGYLRHKCPSPRTLHTATLWNSTMIVCYGHNGEKECNDIWSFDLIKYTWRMLQFRLCNDSAVDHSITSRSSRSINLRYPYVQLSGRYWHSASRLGSLLYITGGVRCCYPIQTTSIVLDLAELILHQIKPAVYSVSSSDVYPDCSDRCSPQDVPSPLKLERRSNSWLPYENTEAVHHYSENELLHGIDNVGMKCAICGILPLADVPLRSHQTVTVEPSSNLKLSSPVIVTVGGWMTAKNMLRYSLTSGDVPQPVESPSFSMTVTQFQTLGRKHVPGLTIMEYESPAKKALMTSIKEHQSHFKPIYNGSSAIQEEAISESVLGTLMTKDKQCIFNEEQRFKEFVLQLFTSECVSIGLNILSWL